ncbi:hypothetical protein ABEV34_07485 [Methylorubrum rhodesianum]|uniref:hypothetical protein n=1 Tax=Methylorubrum rhodesianum TaxID=29427 RepID=UPI003D2BC4B9
MNLAGKSLYIGMCCYRHEMRSETCMGLMSTLKGCLENEIDVYMNLFSDCPYIDLGKSLMVGDFMKNHNSDYVLLIDSDMGFTFNNVKMLIENDVDIVSASYTTRSFPIRQITVPANGKGLVKCSRVPGGFLLMKRSAIMKLEEDFINKGRERATLLPGMKYFHFFGTSIDEKTGLFLGEDYSFCERVAQASIDIHCDFDVRVSHVGDYVFKNDQQTLAMSRMAEEYPRRGAAA